MFIARLHFARLHFARLHFARVLITKRSTCEKYLQRGHRLTCDTEASQIAGYSSREAKADSSCSKTVWVTAFASGTKAGI